MHILMHTYGYIVFDKKYIFIQSTHVHQATRRAHKLKSKRIKETTPLQTSHCKVVCTIRHIIAFIR